MCLLRVAACACGLAFICLTIFTVSAIGRGRHIYKYKSVHYNTLGHGHIHVHVCVYGIQNVSPGLKFLSHPPLDSGWASHAQVWPEAEGAGAEPKPLSRRRAHEEARQTEHRGGHEEGVGWAQDQRTPGTAGPQDQGATGCECWGREWGMYMYRHVSEN